MSVACAKSVLEKMITAMNRDGDAAKHAILRSTISDNLYATAKTLGLDIDYKRLLKEFQSSGTLD